MERNFLILDPISLEKLKKIENGEKLPHVSLEERLKSAQNLLKVEGLLDYLKNEIEEVIERLKQRIEEANE